MSASLRTIRADYISAAERRIDAMQRWQQKTGRIDALALSEAHKLLDMASIYGEIIKASNKRT